MQILEFVCVLPHVSSSRVIKKKGLVERQNRVTGFGIHSIQHVLIGKALFDLLVPIIHVQYIPYDMRSHRPTHIYI